MLVLSEEKKEADIKKRRIIKKKTVTDHKKVFWILMLGAIPIIFLQSAIRTALPPMLEDLRIVPTIGQWIITGYTLIKGIMVPISAFAMNKFRTRQLFLFILGLFVFGSLIAAIGGTFLSVLSGSVLQGISAGIMFPFIQTILFTSFPIKERGSAMGMMGIAMGIGPIFGPSLGGWFVDVLSWQYLFYSLAAVTLVAMVVSYFTLGDMLPQSNPSVDWVAIMYSVFGFGGVLYGLSVIGAEGFASITAWGSIGAGVLFILLFVARIMRSQNPLLNIELLKKPAFLLAILISMFALMVIVGVTNIMPVYVQSVLGRTAVVSGLVVMPGGLIKALLSPISGRIFDHVGIKKLGPVGGALMLIGTILFLFISSSTHPVIPALIYFVISFGFGLLNIPVTTAGMNTLEQSELSHGTAVRHTIRGIGSSFSTAMVFSSMSLVSMFASPQTQLPTDTSAVSSEVNMSGIQGSFAVVILCSFLAFVLTFFFREKN